MDPWAVLWSQRASLLAGFENTLWLFFLSLPAAAGIGALGAMALRRTGPTRWITRVAVDAMRMLPFLLYVYLLYFGLPAVGVRLSAWTVGFIGLITYHAAYVAEILRGAWAVLPAGQLEAARACGYRTLPMYREIILPQLVLQSGPVLANQAIILLKDTAFLSIVTVRELTAAASAIQSTFFIPFQPLLAAIALYWVLTLAVEAGAAGIRRLARRRGMAT